MNNIIKEEYNDIKEIVYKKVLDNGLTVVINKKEELNKVFASFTTYFGARDNSFTFVDTNEEVKLPLGCAHFLEHKLFEMPNGIDASELFAKVGANSNAYTSDTETSYIVSCTSNINDVILTLLDFVQTPCFTNENVKKEKGIIIEELKMYKDTPSDALRLMLFKNLYKYNVLREDIVGNISSIKSITKEILYLCYETFYHPSNMYLVISGDVDVDELFSLIENNQKNKSFKKPREIKRNYIIDQNPINRKLSYKNMDIMMPKVSIGVKLPLVKSNKSKMDLIGFIALENTFGASSSNYQYMLDNELMNNLTYSCSFEDTYSYLRVSANSIKPRELIKFVKKELLNLSNFEIKDLNIYRNALIGSTLINFESEEFICSYYTDFKFNGDNLFNKIKYINDINELDIKEFGKMINKDNIASCIIYPKNKER